MRAPKEPMGTKREQQADNQAQDPGREKGAQNVKGRRSAATRAKHRREQQPQP
jgi:hypothetical protein